MPMTKIATIRRPRHTTPSAQRGLGGIWLRHPRTVAELEREHLLLYVGGYLVVYNDDEEVYACLGLAVDESEVAIPDAWVARPLGVDTIARLRKQGG